MKPKAKPPESPEPKRIETSSLHEVNVWLNTATHQGMVKRCQNLYLAAMIVSKAGGQQKYFYPQCKAHSFEFPFAILHGRDEAEVLIQRLANNVFKCPAHCTNYKPQWKAKAAKPFRWIWSERKLIPQFGNWFIKLPAMVQMLIILGIILAIAPKWKDPLIQIIKAIQGK